MDNASGSSSTEKPRPEEKEATPPEEEIREGKGGIPLWVWVVIAIWLIWAFFLGPFQLFWP